MKDADGMRCPEPSPAARPGERTRPDVYWYRTDNGRVPLCLSCAVRRRGCGEPTVFESALARRERCEDCGG